MKSEQSTASSAAPSGLTLARLPVDRRSTGFGHGPANRGAVGAEVSVHTWAAVGPLARSSFVCAGVEGVLGPVLFVEVFGGVVGGAGSGAEGAGVVGGEVVVGVVV